MNSDEKLIEAKRTELHDGYLADSPMLDLLAPLLLKAMSCLEEWSSICERQKESLDALSPQLASVHRNPARETLTEIRAAFEVKP